LSEVGKASRQSAMALRQFVRFRFKPRFRVDPRRMKIFYYRTQDTDILMSPGFMVFLRALTLVFM
jgi:hypothetical protein